jgi:hypothetical protein
MLYNNWHAYLVVSVRTLKTQQRKQNQTTAHDSEPVEHNARNNGLFSNIRFNIILIGYLRLLLPSDRFPRNFAVSILSHTKHKPSPSKSP